MARHKRGRFKKGSSAAKRHMRKVRAAKKHRRKISFKKGTSARRRRGILAEKLKKHLNIINPFALATSMVKKGVKLHNPFKRRRHHKRHYYYRGHHSESMFVPAVAAGWLGINLYSTIMGSIQAPSPPPPPSQQDVVTISAYVQNISSDGSTYTFNGSATSSKGSIQTIAWFDINNPSLYYGSGFFPQVIKFASSGIKRIGWIALDNLGVQSNTFELDVTVQLTTPALTSVTTTTTTGYLAPAPILPPILVNAPAAPTQSYLTPQQATQLVTANASNPNFGIYGQAPSWQGTGIYSDAQGNLFYLTTASQFPPP